MTPTGDDPEYARWRETEAARQRAEDLAWLERVRPPVFAGDGVMRPEIAEWFAVLAEKAPEAGNLIMVGPNGTRKSWHLWRIVSELVDLGGRRHLEPVTAYEFRRIIAPPVDLERLDRMATAGLLLLDDMGATRLSEWDLDNLFGVIDQRWANRRNTVINGNLLDVRGLFGERIASRLADRSTLVEMPGPDWRRNP